MGVTASSKQRLKMFALSAAAYWLIIAGASAAQDVSLPGGAASLNEAHGDWTVACVVRPDAQGTKVKQCALVQEQFQLKDGQSQARQRVMRVELRPEKGGVKGFLVLPFGLDLASGVTYQLDEGKPGGVQHFRTCLPFGCLVDIDFDAKTVEALKSGKALKVQAKADGGQDMTLAISLAGFSSAYERATALKGA